MLCISCGTEMRLVRVEPDVTMMVTGYEHQTFECPSCRETERRLTFTREPTQQPSQPAPIDEAAPMLIDEAAPAPPASAGQDTAPPVSPAPVHQEEAAPTVSAAPPDQELSAPPEPRATDQGESTAPSRWARAVAKLRGLQERGL
jgi:hypothetical protein